MSKTLPDRDDLLNKNTPSMMATKIFKNMTRDYNLLWRTRQEIL